MTDQLIRPRVIGLIRVSTQGQADDDKCGIPRQRDVIERTVKINNLNCVDMVELQDVSGTNVSNCPEIRLILNKIASKEIDGVVVADLDRLIRADNYVSIGLLQVFVESKAKLYCGDTTIDMATGSGYLLAGLKSIMGGHEIRLFKERVLGSKELKRKNGECPNSAKTLPTGICYDRENEKFVYDAVKLAKVIEAFRLVDEEGICNLRELQRRTGIQHRTLANILRNPTYMGWRIYDTKRGNEKYYRKDGRQADRKKVPRPPEDIIEKQIFDNPPVSPERFQRVQAILANKKQNWRLQRTSNPVVNLGKGVAKCAYCNSILYCNSGKRTDRRRIAYYQCKRNNYQFKRQSGGCSLKNYRQDKLDPSIEAFTSAVLSDEQALRSIIDHTMTSTTENLKTPVSKDDYERELREIARRKDKLVIAYENDAIPLSKLKERTLELDKADAECRAKLQAVEPVDINTSETIRNIIRGALAFQRLSSLQDKQRVIEQLFTEIQVNNEGIVAFRLTPPYLSNAPVPQRGIHTGMASPLGDICFLLPKPYFLPFPTVVKPPTGFKVCRICKATLPLCQFWLTTNGRPRYACIPCQRLQSHRRYLVRKTATRRRMQLMTG